MSRINLTFFLVLIVAVTLRLGYCDDDADEPAKTCQVGRLPDHLKVKGRCEGVIFGGYCDFECEEGFEREGPTGNIKCKKDGDFDQLPTCKAKTCRVGRLPDHLKVKGRCEVVNFGGYCDFECEEGFEREGPTGKIQCKKDGDFEFLPTCKAKTCKLGRLPDHLKVKGRCEVNFGGYCDFECEEGFEREGPTGYIQCKKDGDFEFLPTCKAKSGVVTCKLEKLPDNLKVKGTCVDVTVDAECDFECGEGFDRQGPEGKRKCKADGKFEELPTCKGYTCQSIREGSTRTWTDFCSQADDRVCVEDAKEGPKCVRRGSCKEDDAVDRPGGKIKIQLRGEIALEAEGGQRVDLLRLLSDLSTGKHLSS